MPWLETVPMDERSRFIDPAWPTEVSDGVWSVYFCHVLLARLDERTRTLIRG